ncbi:MAG: M48 family metalloprotease [Bdellovibrionaceae bacterium]|nr:M48 family metalloprotease [Pseudobdellovibrionaceae bacterium]
MILLKYLFHFQVALTIFASIYLFANRFTNIKVLFRERLRYFYFITFLAISVGCISTNRWTLSVFPQKQLAQITEISHATLPIANVSLESAIINQAFNFSEIFYLVLMSITIMGLIPFFRSVYLLNKQSRRIPLFRYGKIAILKGDTHSSPFAFSYGKQSFVVISEQTFKDHKILRYVLAHEFAHIRSKDTLAIYALQFFKFLFWYNPIIRNFIVQIHFYQELRTDTQVLKRSNIVRAQYMAALKQIFESTNMNSSHAFILGIFNRKPVNEYRDRIRNMTEKIKVSKMRYISVMVIILVLSVTTTSLIRAKMGILENRETPPQITMKSPQFYLQFEGSFFNQEYQPIASAVLIRGIESDNNWVLYDGHSVSWENYMNFEKNRMAYLDTRIINIASNDITIFMKGRVYYKGGVESFSFEQTFKLDTRTYVEAIRGHIEISKALDVADARTIQENQNGFASVQTKLSSRVASHQPILKRENL